MFVYSDTNGGTYVYLIPTGTDHIESSSISITIYDLRRQDNKVTSEDTFWSVLESQQLEILSV